MKRIEIVADNTIPYLKGVFESVDGVSIRYIDSSDFTREQIASADVLMVRSIDKCTEQLLVGSNVKLIVTATIGFDHIDVKYCESHGIVWKNVPGCNAASVAQYVVSSLIYLSMLKNDDLRGKKIGIVGVGHVGSLVKRYSEQLGMEVLLCDPPRAEQEGAEEFVTFDEILSSSDVITAHVPLTKGGKYPTYHMFNREAFDRCDKRPCFINTCRGSVVDTQSLIEAKKSGKVSDLVIDCWENEPIISRELLDLTTLASPHIAGFSAEGKATATRRCVEYIVDFFGLQGVSPENIKPNPPLNAVIDLNRWSDHRVSQTIFVSYNPLNIDSKLRNDLELFEYLRNNYSNPNEFSAYRIVNANDKEKHYLLNLDFNS